MSLLHESHFPLSPTFTNLLLRLRANTDWNLHEDDAVNASNELYVSCQIVTGGETPAVSQLIYWIRE